MARWPGAQDIDGRPVSELRENIGVKNLLVISRVVAVMVPTCPGYSAAVLVVVIVILILAVLADVL